MRHLILSAALAIGIASPFAPAALNAADIPVPDLLATLGHIEAIAALPGATSMRTST